ncbi:hypothetical protein [Flavobacterium aciduliphilum]|uniref:YbbD head domain-containing protein n=1 Tax=Flavobacterium aciduliphilum TaxID=1101402 RepID=A0A328YH09_9FLAO|nr:hypothetical protein [Flavobacterium aciduliphilum]RAR72604.1 hypothetical protein CLV55_105174 [Flavobacterium aciduliphilum]
MRKKHLILTFVFSLSFFSCGNGEFEQFYANYEDFKKIPNKRLTGWFPEIITRDSYEIKNSSHLDICAFCSIKYRNKKSIDSIFSIYKSVPVSNFKIVLEKYSEKTPEWFPNIDSERKFYNVIKLNNHVWALREKNKKQVFTISLLMNE